MKEINKKITKKQAKKILETKGEIRGSCIETDWKYIRREKGRQGLRKVERRMEELDCPLKLKQIRATQFYPLGYDLLSLKVIQEVFDFDQQDFKKMGTASVQISLILRILMKYTIPFRTVVSQAPKMWKEHFSIGKLEVVEIDEEEKHMILRLRGFKVSPLYCAAFKGYFLKVLELAGREPRYSKETKCMFEGDDYHQFLVKWK